MGSPRYRRDQEAAAFLAAYREPVFSDIHALTVPFESEPEVVAALLPPPLEPGTHPRVVVSVAEVRRSNCAGAFFFASVDIACRFRGEEGAYCLTMPVSTDTALIFGRELYGEPKKLAEIRFEQRHGGLIHGSVTRHGIPFLELSAVLEPCEEPPRSSVQVRYHFRFLPTPSGELPDTIDLIRVVHRNRIAVVGRGEGTITVRDSPHDPLFDIPVRRVLGATLSEGESRTSGEVVATIRAEAFLPFAFTKVDDLLVWAERPVRIPR